MPVRDLLDIIICYSSRNISLTVVITSLNLPLSCSIPLRICVNLILPVDNSMLAASLF
nr:MAG TPA: hypothetical protein [Caudoviricetes sp.]